MSKFRFIKNDKGATVVEYSLIAPMFFLMLFGIFEVAAVFFVQTSLEAAIFRVSRFGRTGDVELGKTQVQTAREILDQLTYGMLDNNRLHLRIQPAANFASMTVSQVTEDSIDFGGPNEPVVYTLTYDWPLFTPLISDAMGEAGILPLTASAVVMNEPF